MLALDSTGSRKFVIISDHYVKDPELEGTGGDLNAIGNLIATAGNKEIMVGDSPQIRPYIRSNDPDEIFNRSDYVAEVTIASIDRTSKMSYIAEVQFSYVYKGDFKQNDLLKV